MGNKFSSNLKEIRKNAKLRQEDVAKFLNMSVTSYGHYERGRNEPDINTIIKLADFFNVSLSYLLGYNKTKNDDDEVDYAKILRKDGLTDTEIEVIINTYKTFVNSKKIIQYGNTKNLQ